MPNQRILTAIFSAANSQRESSAFMNVMPRRTTSSHKDILLNGEKGCQSDPHSEYLERRRRGGYKCRVPRTQTRGDIMTRVVVRIRTVSIIGLIAFTSLLRAQTEIKKDGAAKSKAEREVEVRFVDGSTMKLQLRDERIELETEYGRLLIPATEVKRIDFGLRMPDETRKRIAAAIHELGDGDFRKRDAAEKYLVSMKAKAFPALSQTKTKDAEMERRIEQVLEKIREDSPAEDLEVPPHDIVHTASSRIAGRIKVETFRVVTLPFGEQAVKLADMRTLHSGDGEPAAVAGGVLDAAMFNMQFHQIGKTLAFRVTAPPAGVAMNMGVWGTDVYTTDTSLLGAALHAGVLRPGETGVVRVTFVGQHPGFQASMRNGVMSNAYGAYPGYRIEQP